MRLARPTGEYVAQMLDPDGWPGVDEDTYYDRAQQYTQVLRQVTEVLRNCCHEQGRIFRGEVWSGGAAGAANRELGIVVDALTALQSGLASVITWHRYVAGSIIAAKSGISDNVEGARKQIEALQKDSKLTPAKRLSAINTVLLAAYGANAGMVAATAEQILASKTWKPPHNALEDLLDGQAPLPDGSSPVTPTPGDKPTPGDEPEPAPGDEPAPPRAPSGPRGGPTIPVLPGAGVPPVSPVSPRSPVWSTTPPGTAGPPAPGVPGPAAPSAPRKPAASAPSEGAGDGGEDPAAPVAQSAEGEAQDSGPRVAPAAASGMPAMPMAPSAAGGGGGGGGGGVPASGGEAGGGAGSGASGGKAPGVRPAAATSRPAARRDPAARRESADRGESVEGAAMAAIPVSAARAERDAIAQAATADAARRSGEQMQLARRIAAALNVSVLDAGKHFGFFWMTALTTEGAIVVANNFGLAYIPEGVQLPEQVSMATADKSIPAAERARWVTYPLLALQGWAAHRGVTLRAVIATEEQFAGSDPGVAKVVLEAEDIPDSGEMSGRSPLEVVDPEAAERLAGTPDARLTALLPPAPADAEADDERPRLWLRVLRPMITSDPSRQVPHLQGFHAYATYAQQFAAHEAHGAADPVAQRYAIADWLYWKHLAGLLDAALSSAS